MKEEILKFPAYTAANFQATMMLRWRKYGIGDPILQQLWLGSDGNHDWRDIEIVTEEEN